MKQKVFFLEDRNLIEYLQKYGRGIKSKDYEFSVSLHAKAFWEEKLGQKLAICFEQNDKMHSYPARFRPSAEEIKDILLTYNKEDTPVDFALAPIAPDGALNSPAYPFQIKKFIPELENNLNSEFAEYINKKTNSYRDEELCIIFLPVMIGVEKNKIGMSIDEVKKNLKIEENSVRAIYCFQFSAGKPSFIPLWVSQKALDEPS